MSQKPPRMYVIVKDGKPREPNRLKGLLVPHVDVVDAKDKVEFFIHAVKEAHLVKVRSKLDAAGLAEAPIPERPDPFPKPYGFAANPKELTTSAPSWHDGTSSASRLSGEIRFELEALTPLLVGWERGQVGDNESDWPLQASLANVGQLASQKSVRRQLIQIRRLNLAAVAACIREAHVVGDDEENVGFGRLGSAAMSELPDSASSVRCISVFMLKMRFLGKVISYRFGHGLDAEAGRLKFHHLAKSV